MDPANSKPFTKSRLFTSNVLLQKDELEELSSSAVMFISEMTVVKDKHYNYSKDESKQLLGSNYY